MARITRKEIDYYLEVLNRYTKRNYIVTYSNGYLSLNIQYKSGINTIISGLTIRECYNMLLAMVNLFQFENSELDF